MSIQSILWRNIYWPGHEASQLFTLNSRWHLTGSAVFTYEQQACRLDYLITSDSGWHTVSGKVAGWVGQKPVEIDITVDADQHWRLNGLERPKVSGCLDLDLNFSPSTNLLPIRRLNLATGQAAEVKAAWLRFPSFELETLPQLYRRLDELTYRYESAGGQFVADLKVNSNGFVTFYPGLWEAEAAS